MAQKCIFVWIDMFSSFVFPVCVDAPLAVTPIVGANAIISEHGKAQAELLKNDITHNVRLSDPDCGSRFIITNQSNKPVIVAIARTFIDKNTP